jgi:hypothetical protein
MAIKNVDSPAVAVLPLTIELVPKSAWYSNVRSNVTESEWNAIRRKSYSMADNKCEICGDVGKNQGVMHNVECHEIWQYNDETKTQKLIGLISLCPYCHKTKHAGLAQINGEAEIVIQQLIKVNNMTRHEANEYLNAAFELWRERSNHEWSLDIDFLDGYVI